MKPVSLRKMCLAVSMTVSAVALSGCDPNAVYTGGSVYYDSMLWNDYYYGRPPSRPPRPERPVKPVHPIAPVPPPRPTPPIARPPVARPPIHRPR
ncbi:hypothetical protein LCL97_16240 [Seohaeicola saemankumensis]|nr:hypothetical protein [Seohaeicola saemankumensis]MCA0872385.1 hypothetical protein [Seohaeicola saemankumensis]